MSKSDCQKEFLSWGKNCWIFNVLDWTVFRSHIDVHFSWKIGWSRDFKIHRYFSPSLDEKLSIEHSMAVHPSPHPIPKFKHSCLLSYNATCTTLTTIFFTYQNLITMRHVIPFNFCSEKSVVFLHAKPLFFLWIYVVGGVKLELIFCASCK